MGEQLQRLGVLYGARAGGHAGCCSVSGLVYFLLQVHYTLKGFATFCNRLDACQAALFTVLVKPTLG
jgi:hypothetical protein